MATEPKAVPDSPEIAALQFKEKTLVEKIKKLGALDEAALLRAGHELSTAKTNAEKQLAEVRAEIKRLSK